MKKKMISVMLSDVLAAGMSAGSVQAAAEDTSGDLYVFIAASLNNAMEEIQKDFNEDYPDVNILYNADSSGTLQTQIEEGSRCDIFFSAATKQMDALVDEELAKKDYIDTNPLTILQEDFETIENRKKNPKEGSYTNYLFTQGIDKILKKCGEEASEIIIAAKNPNAEELKYEIADFLYHMMVLMAECGLTWEDITRELANRR